MTARNASAERTRKPNVVCFITDDTDFSMLGYSGGSVLTPHIDAIARQGVHCRRFYTAAPVCTPSRYVYLTGHYAGRCPAEHFRKSWPENEPHCITWNTDLIPEKEPCLGHALQQAGYTTGYVGKWHAGPGRGKLGLESWAPDADPADPEVDARLKAEQEVLAEQMRRNGFDYAARLFWNNPDNLPLRKLQNHNNDWIAKGALDFLDQSAADEKPFFLYVATTTIHGPSHILSVLSDPRLTPAGFCDDHLDCLPPRASILRRIEDAPHVRLDHRSVGALWTDDVVGAVVERLEQLGLTDETAVIFSTDHNCFDGKATCGEGGVHIPFAMRWPGHIPPGSVCDAMIQNIDFVPTLLEMCGGEAPEGIGTDGRSVLGLLTGRQTEAPDRDDLFFEFGYSRGVATDRWKYIAVRLPRRLIEEMKSGRTDMGYDITGRFGGEMQMARYPHYADPDQLYDLWNDPGEQHNLAGNPAMAGVLAEMRARLKRYTETFERPFDVDHVDPFLWSDAYRRLMARTATQDPNRHEWYRKGWY